MTDHETMEVKIARIDENVKNIVSKIEDHEKRIRDNEKFKNRGYGALGLISAVLTIVGVAVGKILLG